MRSNPRSANGPAPCLVTHADTLLGAAIARALATAGHAVRATGTAPDPRLDGIPYHPATEAAAVASFAGSRLAAAILIPGPAPDDPPALIDAGLLAPAHLAQALHPALAAAKGTLVLLRTPPTATPGAAALQSALAGLARALRAEWRGTIHVALVDLDPDAPVAPVLAALESR
jgi:NAD(P)-dependent dehydrogenase (short-subunit alcohol dehydrogenase family)